MARGVDQVERHAGSGDCCLSSRIAFIAIENEGNVERGRGRIEMEIYHIYFSLLEVKARRGVFACSNGRRHSLFSFPV